MNNTFKIKNSGFWPIDNNQHADSDWIIVSSDNEELVRFSLFNEPISVGFPEKEFALEELKNIIPDHVFNELETVLEEGSEINPTNMCQQCGGVVDSDSTWCGC
jgi:hypothetical protein